MDKMTTYMYMLLPNFIALKAQSIWQGGGGGLGFLVRPKYFFGQNRSKIIFFAGPSGRIIIFRNRKLHL